MSPAERAPEGLSMPSGTLHIPCHPKTRLASSWSAAIGGTTGGKVCAKMIVFARQAVIPIPTVVIKAGCARNGEPFAVRCGFLVFPAQASHLLPSQFWSISHSMQKTASPEAFVPAGLIVLSVHCTQLVPSRVVARHCAMGSCRQPSERQKD